jgi:hypothetical protein
MEAAEVDDDKGRTTVIVFVEIDSIERIDDKVVIKLMSSSDDGESQPPPTDDDVYLVRIEVHLLNLDIGTRWPPRIADERVIKLHRRIWAGSLGGTVDIPILDNEGLSYCRAWVLRRATRSERDDVPMLGSPKAQDPWQPAKEIA